MSKLAPGATVLFAALLVTGCTAQRAANNGDSGSASIPASTPITTPPTGSGAVEGADDTPPTGSAADALSDTGGQADLGGPVPSCGYPAQTRTTGPTVTPAPDTCLFTGGSPGCPYPSEIISQTTTRTLATGMTPTASDLGGFGRWGGSDGGSMCFGEFADRSVTLTNGDRAILVELNDHAIVYADRIDLTRSSGVWGVIANNVADVQVVDAARPAGVSARTYPLIPNGADQQPNAGTGNDLQVFIAPVSTSPVTITALDGQGRTLQTVTIAAARP